MKHSRLLSLILASGIVAIAPRLSLAQADQSTASNRLDQLDQKVRVLERRLELADENALAKAKETPVLVAGQDGFALNSADGAYKLKLRAQLQMDGRFYLNDDEKPIPDTFLVRRARPIIEGTLANQFDFKIMPDFGGGTAVLQDGYMDYRSPSSLFNVRAGKFKAPVGLERLQSDSDSSFVEPALVTSLVPNRDVGIDIYGDALAKRVEYAVGVFNGVPDGASGDSDINDGKDFVARIFANPFKASDIEALAGLGFGVGGSYGDEGGNLTTPGLPSLKTTGQQTFFSYTTSTNLSGTTIADGTHSRLSPQAYYYWRSLGMLGEYAISSQDVKKGTKSDTIKNDAWQLTVSYVLTGEKASYKGVTPLWAFQPSVGHWGALEIVGRYSELNVDDAAFSDYADPKKSAQSVHAWGVGLNWYLTRNLKAMLDYERSSFDGGASSGDREDENVILSRLQVAF
jgi:phosphate-selective porin OprO and OprP